MELNSTEIPPRGISVEYGGIWWNRVDSGEGRGEKNEKPISFDGFVSDPKRRDACAVAAATAVATTASRCFGSVTAPSKLTCFSFPSTRTGRTVEGGGMEGGVIMVSLAIGHVKRACNHSQALPLLQLLLMLMSLSSYSTSLS